MLPLIWIGASFSLSIPDSILPAILPGAPLKLQVSRHPQFFIYAVVFFLCAFRGKNQESRLHVFMQPSPTFFSRNYSGAEQASSVSHAIRLSYFLPLMV